MKSSLEHSITDSRGYIHSIESFGTVDGPGVRFVVFFQGCPLRCKFCHNPDTWELRRADTMSVGEILDQYERNRSFYGKRGGLTATGGEPLVQLDFLIDLFTACKERDINTCLDTSGWPYRKDKDEDYQRLFKVTDLVLLDIKNSDKRGHIELTGVNQEPVLAFGDALCKAHVPVLIRHVCVPGITDRDEELEGVGRIIAHWNNVKALDVLPYHTMGVNKYSVLGLEYPLKGVPALTAEEAKIAREKIIKAYKDEKEKLKEDYSSQATL